MNKDSYGQIIATTDDLFRLLYQNPNLDISRFVVDNPDNYNDSIRRLHFDAVPLRKAATVTGSIDEFDQRLQNNWFMPDRYKNLDICSWLIDQCRTEKEIERVNYELVLYRSKNLIMLLCYLKYLIDTLRNNRVVWGVGRGSSVASYVLYLIGVHRIDSLKFELDVHEFLK